MKKILFISRHSPYGNSKAREALDALLAASAYDQDLSILFMDDGVFQLISNQQPANIYQKNLGASLKALEIYDIHNVYVDENALLKRRIDKKDLVLESVTVLNAIQIQQLMAEQDQLVSF